MSEWWTYSPSELLSYSPQTWYRLLELHNADLWPAQLAGLALGVLVLASVVRGRDRRGRGIALVLAASFIAVAWTFHLRRYVDISFAATYFGWAFALQGIALAVLAWTGNGLQLAVPRGPRGACAATLIALAAVGYPALAPVFGRTLATAESFAAMPDPTALATIGVLALSDARRRFALAALPLAWCAISATLLHALGAPEWPIVAGAAAAGAVAIATRLPQA